MRLLQDTRLELWCEALESGKYEKTVGRLCKYLPWVRAEADGQRAHFEKPCFCVLGVATEVYWEHNPDELEFDIKRPDDGSWPYRSYYWFSGVQKFEASGWLPPKVAKWYGIREQGQFVRPFKFNNGAFIACLDSLNDRQGWTFKALAGVIRKGYLERTLAA